jgi:choline dehydrogenase-like flavoprotein
LRLRSRVEERYGKNFIPQDMTIQDYPVTFEELEPHFDHFEKVCGVSGIAGNLNGQIKPGGNPFEGRRGDEFPTPPLPSIYVADLFDKAAAEFGYKSFPVPAANSVQSQGQSMRQGAPRFCCGLHVGYCLAAPRGFSTVRCGPRAFDNRPRPRFVRSLGTAWRGDKANASSSRAICHSAN